MVGWRMARRLGWRRLGGGPGGWRADRGERVWLRLWRVRRLWRLWRVRVCGLRRGWMLRRLRLRACLIRICGLHAGVLRLRPGLLRLLRAPTLPGLWLWRLPRHQWRLPRLRRHLRGKPRLLRGASRLCGSPLRWPLSIARRIAPTE